MIGANAEFAESLIEGVEIQMNIVLVLVGGFSLYCLSTYIKPLNEKRDSNWLLLGVLGLVWVVLQLRITSSLIFAAFPHAFVPVRVASRIVLGVLPSALICRVWRWGAKAMLILASILSVAPPLTAVLLVLRIGHEINLHTIFASSKFYAIEAWPVGIAIPAIVLLFRSKKNGRKSTGGDGRVAAADVIAENGTGA